MMKRKKIIGMGLALMILMISLPARSKSNNFSSYGPETKRLGAGLYLGEPSGLTFKAYLTSKLAIDGIGGWGFRHEVFTAIGDVTYDFLDIPVNSNVVTLPFYAGVGMKLQLSVGPNDDTVVGIRTPIGVAVQWIHSPIEVFAEIAPGIDVTPSTEFDFMGGVGVRFYF